ncbi:response regulator transcription factor [Cupriavidus basilensis]
MTVAAMKAGAEDFMAKPFRDQDLLDAVSAALEKDRRRREGMRRIQVLRASFQTLTPRESEVMALAVTGLMNKQIAGEMGISEVTVKIHRGQAMRKMNARNLCRFGTGWRSGWACATPNARPGASRWRQSRYQCANCAALSTCWQRDETRAGMTTAAGKRLTDLGERAKAGAKWRRDDCIHPRWRSAIVRRGIGALIERGVRICRGACASHANSTAVPS